MKGEESEMSYDYLSENELHRAIAQALETMAALHRYQDFLITGLGLPRSEVAKLPIVKANLEMLDKLHMEVTSIERQIDERFGDGPDGLTTA
jgi:hypothetical protein